MNTKNSIDGVGRGMAQMTFMNVVWNAMSTSMDWTRTTIITIFCLFSCFVSYYPVDTGDTWNTVLITNSLCQQPISNLPGKHGGILLLVFAYGIHNMRCGNF